MDGTDNAYNPLDDPEFAADLKAYFGLNALYNNQDQAWQKILEASNQTLNTFDADQSALLGLEQFRRVVDDSELKSVIISRSGEILYSNHEAQDLSGQGFTARKLSDLPFASVDSGDLVEQIFKQSGPNSNLGEPNVIRIVDTETQDAKFIAALAVQTKSGEDVAILFFFRTDWSELTYDLFSKKSISKTETEVIVRFLEGKSIKDIAEERSRSVNTVKKQFYAALEKAGYANRLDLVRDLFESSDIAGIRNTKSVPPTNPYRLETTVFRPGGRRLDVILTGDFHGTPFVYTTFIFGRTFPKSYERVLYEAGILVIQVARPGFGKTSLPVDGLDEAECYARDVEALLDQFGFEQATLFGASTNMAATLRLANRLPHRFNAIFATMISAPSALQNTTELADSDRLDKESWPTFEFKFQRLLYHTFLTSASVLGWRRVMAAMLSSSPELMEFTLRPENIVESEAAFKASTVNGIGRLMQDFDDNLGNWLPLLSDCIVPIFLLQATDDDMISIASIRELVGQFSDKIHLTEAPGVNFLLHENHSDLFIKTMMRAANT